MSDRDAAEPPRSSTTPRPSVPGPTDDPILDRIGDTPLVEYPDPHLDNLYCKLETENPTGSMKDRIALAVLTEQLEDEDTVVEASSGNTAGAVALVANRLGLDCHVTCPASTSPTKLGYVEALGATVHRCPDVDGDHPEHYHAVARDLADEHDAFFLDQYHNPGNPAAHARWTGPELRDQAGPSLTHVVCPMGTGGTLSGIARYLDRAASDHGGVTAIGVDAERSNVSTAFRGEAPVEYDTDVEGLGKGQELPTMWFEHVDDVRDVADETAFERTRTAAREHGLLIGPSSGAGLEVALEVARSNPEARVATVVCDGAEQYFDSVFAD